MFEENSYFRADDHLIKALQILSLPHGTAEVGITKCPPTAVIQNALSQSPPLSKFTPDPEKTLATELPEGVKLQIQSIGV